jgi:serine/threonine protein kinase
MCGVRSCEKLVSKSRSLELAALNPRLVDLSDDDRRAVESWLLEFEQGWDERLLKKRAGQIPPGSSWRLRALAEMVKIDLERQWRLERRVGLESYLEQFPELGSQSDLSADLIRAENQLRRQFGDPLELDDATHRLPEPAEELTVRIARDDPAVAPDSSVASPLASASKAQKPTDSPRRLPEQLGRYRIFERLGQGAMGSVYLAQDTHLKRPVALKIPDLGSEADPTARKRFLEEARAAATLDHPYLCRVYDAGEIDGQLYLAMAYIEGESLASLIGHQGWPERQVAALVGKLALALQQAHGRKVIHRDLKPANIMIKTTGQRREPVIVDFGLARREDLEQQRLTRTGQIMGTLSYMAPEQIRGDANEIGPACDIYALGVILYELLTGGLPFEGSGLAVAGQILTVNPAPPSTIRGDLTPALEAICLKAMAKKIEDRYGSMGELAAALTGFLQSAVANTQPEAPSGSIRLPLKASGERRQPAGSDSLVGQFLQQLAGDDAFPSLVPAPEQAVSGRSLPEHIGRHWLKIVAAGALVLCVVAYMIGNRSPLRDTVGRNPREFEILNGNAGDPPPMHVRKEQGGTSLSPVTVRAENRASIETEDPAGGSASVDAADGRDRANNPRPILGPDLTRGSSSTQRLFNGTDLTGWELVNCDERIWRVDSHMLVADNPSGSRFGRTGWPGLLSRRSFTEFVFSFEYQSVPEFDFAAIWWTLPGEIAPLFRPNISRVGLKMDRKEAIIHKTKQSELKGGEGWNLVEIEARQNLLRISVNAKESGRWVLDGKPAEPIALQTTKPEGRFPRPGMDRRSGRVGFVATKGTGRFRNIEITEILPR